MLRRYFKILDGEFRKVFLMQSSIFLIISSLLILKPTFTSIFLTEHGVRQLPVVYLFIAIAAFIINYTVNHFQDRLIMIRVVNSTHIINMLILAMIYALMVGGKLSGWVTTFCLVYVSMYALLTTTQFWQMVGQILNIRDAKRLIGIVGSGAIAGGIFGGYLASSLVNVIGNSGLVILVIVILIINLLLSNLLWKYKSIDISASPFSAAKRTNIFSLLTSKHVKNTAIVIGLGVIVSKLVDFHFNFIILKIPRTSEELTSFLAFWFSTINVIGFLIQLLLTSRIVNRIGMQKSMYILPGGTFMMVILSVVFPGITTAILLKANDGALKQSIYKSAYELCLLPIHNSIRNKVKYFIDLVVDSVATGISGIILLLLMRSENIPIFLIAGMNIGFIICWIFFIRKTGKSYHYTFSRNIEKYSGTNADEILFTYQNKALPDQIKDLKKIIGRNDGEIDPQIIQRIEGILFNKKMDDIIQFFKDESNKLSISAVKVSLAAGISNQKINNFYQKANIQKKLNVLEGVSHYLPDNQKLRVSIGFNSKVAKLIHGYDNRIIHLTNQQLYQLMKIIVLSKSYNKYYFIKQSLNEEISVEDKLAAVRAVRFGTAKSFANELIQQIDHPLIKNDIIQTLASYQNGYVHFFKKNLLEKSRIYPDLVLVLSKIESQESVDLLFKLLNHKYYKNRRTALFSLNRIRENNPQLAYRQWIIKKKIREEVSNLKQLIAAYHSIHLERSSIDSKKEKLLTSILHNNRILISQGNLRLFILLGLFFEKKQIDNVYRALNTANLSTRNYALDYLDDFLPFQMKKDLLPLFEVISERKFDDEVLQRISTKPIKFQFALRVLYQWKDQKLNRKIQHFAIEHDDLKIRKWASQMKMPPKDRNSINWLKKIS